MPNNDDFKGYCRTLTDAQLEGVLAKEWAAARGGGAERVADYRSAVSEAERRGWVVLKGARL